MGLSDTTAATLPWAEIYANTTLALAINDASAERLLFVTPAYARLHGYEPEELTGSLVADMYDPEARRHLAQQVAEAARARALSFRAPHRRKDGSTFPARVDAHAVPDGDGRVRFWVVSVEDLTELARAAEAQASLAAIVESSEDAIIGKSLDGLVTSWNAAAERILGWRADEIVGLPVTTIIPAELHDEEQALVARMRRGERVTHVETARLTRDGRRLAVAMSVSPVRDADGVVVGTASILRDVTLQREAEAAERFLAAASVRLAQSLDAHATVAALADLAIETLADGCLVTLVDHAASAQGHSPFVQAACASRAPGRAALVLETERLYPLPPDAASGYPRAIRTGESELVPEGTFDEAVLPAIAADAEHLGRLRALEMRSGLVVPLLARGRTLGAITLVRHGPERRPAFTERDRTIAEELGRRAGAALDNAMLLAEARASADRTARLQAVTAGLARALTVAEVADAVVREGVVAFQASDGVLYLLDDEGDALDVAAAVGYEGLPIAEFERVPLDMDMVVTRNVRTGEPMLVESRARMMELIPSTAAYIDHFPQQAWLGFPVLSGGRAIGSLTFGFSEPRTFSVEDRALGVALAQQCALALERARLLDRERAARAAAERAAARTAQLQKVTAALVEAQVPDDVSEVVLRHALPALGADAGFIAALRDDGGPPEVVLLQGLGYHPNVPALFARFPLDAPYPAAEALRSGAPVWLATRAERLARYPALVDNASTLDFSSWAFLPLIAHGVTLGVLSIAFRTPHGFDDDERRFATALAQQCAQAIERSRLHEAERVARTAAAAARTRAEFLAEASRVLASSLDYTETLDAVARSAVPGLGDWCAVDMVERPELAQWPPTIRRLAVWHQDAAKIAWARDLERRALQDWSAPTGFPRVLREGVTEFYPVITEEMIVAAAKSPEELVLLREIDFHAYCCVPLMARGRVVGAITFAMTDSGRHYEEADLALAEDLAHRASLAIEHAALYRDAQEASRAKSDFLATMSHELRTPLNAIGGYMQLLGMGIHGPVTTAQQEAFGRVTRAQERLLALINDILNFERIQSGHVEYDVRPVPLDDVVAEVVALMEPQRALRTLTLELPPPGGGLVVLADRQKLAQILLNLLSNAFKFTPAKGRVVVHTLPDPADASRILLRVADTGIGVPPDKVQSIFEPFVQLGRGLASSGEGTGLGLSISRDLARGMDGDLVAEPSDAGASFLLSLPRT